MYLFIFIFYRCFEFDPYGINFTFVFPWDISSFSLINSRYACLVIITLLEPVSTIKLMGRPLTLTITLSCIPVPNLFICPTNSSSLSDSDDSHELHVALTDFCFVFSRASFRQHRTKWFFCEHLWHSFTHAGQLTWPLGCGQSNPQHLHFLL